MINTPVRKCFKVNLLEEKDMLITIEDDIVYVRNHPYVYLNIGNGEWKAFTKVYSNGSHPKYNMDKLNSLSEPFMFKIENFDDLSAVPAKAGDLIYRNGDTFMYVKVESGGITSYRKILKV
jgi:hypothetical protein